MKRRLTLRRETVRALADGALIQAAGGTLTFAVEGCDTILCGTDTTAFVCPRRIPADSDWGNRGCSDLC